jgi:hypothetical protein
MKLYWEWIFFSGLFSAFALYPVVRPYASLIIAQQPVFNALAGAAALALVAIILHAEWHRHRTRAWLAAAAGSAAIAAIAFAHAAAVTTPPLSVWFIGSFLALITLGYMIIKRFFRDAEHYFRHRWHHIVVVSLGVTCSLLLIAQLALFVPPFFLGIIAAAAVALHAAPVRAR